jgi:hypothetical protein
LSSRICMRTIDDLLLFAAIPELTDPASVSLPVRRWLPALDP